MSTRKFAIVTLAVPVRDEVEPPAQWDWPNVIDEADVVLIGAVDVLLDPDVLPSTPSVVTFP